MSSGDSDRKLAPVLNLLITARRRRSLSKSFCYHELLDIKVLHKMVEFKTPPRKRCKSRAQDSPELGTPIQTPDSPVLQQIGYGTGVNVYNLERSPRAGFARSPWAIKKPCAKVDRENYCDRIRFEADVLRQLTHPNIVGFRGFIEISGAPCLAMEKLDCSLGDIREQRFEAREGPFPANDIMKITYEMMKGLEYLHHVAHILHGDIKSYNVLTSKDYKIVKLCDFGLSLPLTESLELDITKVDRDYMGAESWMAPEIIFEDVPVTNKADIWASGIVIWEMIALTVPHLPDSEEDQSDNSLLEMQNVTTNDISRDSTGDSSCLSDLENTKCTIGTRPPLPDINLGEEYGKVLELFFRCTILDYMARPSAKELVDYFKHYVYKTNDSCKDC